MKRFNTQNLWWKRGLTHPQLGKHQNERTKDKIRAKNTRDLIECKPVLAYLLGAFLGDGCCSTNKKNRSYYVRFYPGLSEQFKDRIASCLREIGLRPYCAFYSNKWRGQWVVRVYSKALCSFLSCYKNDPTAIEVYLDDRNLKIQFLLAFVEAEGSKENGHGSLITNTDERIMRVTQGFLIGLGCYLELKTRRYGETTGGKDSTGWKPSHQLYIPKRVLGMMRESLRP
jgi:hypothetical protein